MKLDGLMLASFGMAVCTLALPAPAPARTIEGWDITATGDNCVMQSTFQDDVTLALVWNPKSGQLGFMAAGKGWDELRGRTDKPATLELTFDGNLPHAIWADDGAHVVITSDKSGVIGDWGSEHSDELAKTAVRATGVSVRVGNRRLGDYDLSGVPAAYRELMRCGSELTAK